jgi:YebC/PmpR family DNA-binding regulatory protein
MSGHSKWSSIKHKKGAADAKRGKIFTKLIKEITVAARMGGSGDPDANPRLRTAILAAKVENMPKDNIERGIKKGTGELEGVDYEENTYEGYGPGGAAVFLESLTDNKNRAVADIRHIFSKCGGNLGENGCVAWMFDKKGYIVVERSAIDEDSLMEAALEAGAEDVREDDSNFEVITAPEDFEAVKAAIDEKEIPYLDAEVTMLPQTATSLQGKEADQMIRLMDMLDDCEDVQKVSGSWFAGEDIALLYAIDITLKFDDNNTVFNTTVNPRSNRLRVAPRML